MDLALRRLLAIELITSRLLRDLYNGFATESFAVLLSSVQVGSDESSNLCEESSSTTDVPSSAVG